MPQENFFMRLHSGQYQFKVPFIIYLDFEVILQSLEETDSDPLSSYMRDILYSYHLCIWIGRGSFEALSRQGLGGSLLQSR